MKLVFAKSVDMSGDLFDAVNDMVKSGTIAKVEDFYPAFASANPEITSVASEVANEVEPDNKFGFGILTIIMVIAIIVNVVRAVQWCKDHKKGEPNRKNPNAVHRFKMRGMIRSGLKKAGKWKGIIPAVIDLWTGKGYSSLIENGVIKVGGKVTEAKLMKIMEEAK